MPETLASRSALADRLVSWFVVVAVLLYAAWFSWFSLHRHSVYETDAFDLANMEQAVWNTTQGRPLDFTNFEGLTNRLGAHVEPILLLIALPYLAWPKPDTLLVIQSVVIALGAFPISWLARDLLRSRLAAVVFPVSYLLFPALQAANMYDFHALTLVSAFLGFAFWFAHRGMVTGYWIAVVAAMSCKEDVPLPVVMLGLFVAFVLKRPKLGLATSALAVLWFVIAVQVVIPHFNPEKQSPYLDTRYGHLGENMREIISTLLFKPAYWIGYVTAPSKLAYVRDLLTPLAFVSVFAPLALSVLSPTLLLILLSGSKLQNTLELEHYPAPLVPVVVISAIYGLYAVRRASTSPRFAALARWSAFVVPTGSIVILVSSIFYHSGRGLTPLSIQFDLKPRTERHLVADRLVSQVPVTARVTATGGLNAHLAARQTLYVYPRIDDADLVFVDFAPSTAPTVNRDRFEEIARLRRSGFGLLAAEQGYLMLAQGRADEVSAEQAFRMPAPAGYQAESPASVRFGDLEYLGHDLVTESRATGAVRLAFRANRSLPSDLRLFTVILDSNGHPRPATEAELIAPIWFAPDRWEPGQTYFVETKRWGLRETTGDLAIGLVVGRIASPWEAAGRIRPSIAGGPALLTVWEGVLHVATLHSDGRRVTDVTPSRLTALPTGVESKNVTLDPVTGLVLRGLTGAQMVCRAPCQLDLTLYWSAERTIDRPHHRFVHLVDSSDRPLAQADGPPDGGRRPTSDWKPSEIVADWAALPAGSVPSGSYRLIAGFYDPVTGARLAGQTVDVGTVQIVP